jgi:hypothetical protein
MRGSCLGSVPEADLSCRFEALSEIERAQGAGGGVREVGEASVPAMELGALRLLVRALSADSNSATSISVANTDCAQPM